MLLFVLLCVPFHPYEYGPSLVHLRLLAVVDPKLAEQQLILILGEATLKLCMCLSRCETSFLHESPERRIVKIVYVAVTLPPGEVVLEILQRRVEYYPRIERGDTFHRQVRKILRPKEDVSGRKEAQHAGEDLIFAPVENLGRLFKHKREFIRVAIGQDYFCKVLHYFFCTFSHQFDASHIIGFFKPVNIAELCEASSINSHNYICVWKQLI